MIRFVVESCATINGSARDVYAILADYKHGHPRIMPRKYCDGLRVLKGSGVGENTRIEVRFNIFGQKETLVMDISEPEPGRVLQEIDTNAKNITQFIVDPLDEGTCTVTLRTSVLSTLGFQPLAAVDMWMKKFVLRSMFEEELKILDQVMVASQTV